MSKIYTEATFEAAIENSLIADGGYKQGDPNNFDRGSTDALELLLKYNKEDIVN